MVFLPILAALLGSTETILSKFFFTKFKLKSKEYLASDFLVIILLMTLFLPIFYQNPSVLTDLRFLLYFLGVVVCAIFGNLFHFKALNAASITSLEPFRIFRPFVGIIIAFLFFREEITTLTVTLLVVASLALVISQKSFVFLKKQQGTKYVLLAMLFFSFEPFLLKEVLTQLNPFMTYYVRAIGVFVILYVFLRPELIILEKGKTKFITAISTMSTVKKVLIYFGYASLGVLNTILILMLRYPLEYLFAKLSLKEKLEWRNVLSSALILGCVLVYTMVA